MNNNKSIKPYKSPFFTKKEHLNKNGIFKDERFKYKFYKNSSITIGYKRNKMALAARGKYVIHMDDDDYYDKTY